MLLSVCWRKPFTSSTLWHHRSSTHSSRLQRSCSTNTMTNKKRPAAFPGGGLHKKAYVGQQSAKANASTTASPANSTEGNAPQLKREMDIFLSSYPEAEVVKSIGFYRRDISQIFADPIKAAQTGREITREKFVRFSTSRIRVATKFLREAECSTELQHFIHEVYLAWALNDYYFTSVANGTLPRSPQHIIGNPPLNTSPYVNSSMDLGLTQAAQPHQQRPGYLSQSAATQALAGIQAYPQENQSRFGFQDLRTGQLDQTPNSSMDLGLTQAAQPYQQRPGHLSKNAATQALANSQAQLQASRGNPVVLDSSLAQQLVDTLLSAAAGRQNATENQQTEPIRQDAPNVIQTVEDQSSQLPHLNQDSSSSSSNRRRQQSFVRDSFESLGTTIDDALAADSGDQHGDNSWNQGQTVGSASESNATYPVSQDCSTNITKGSHSAATQDPPQPSRSTRLPRTCKKGTGYYTNSNYPGYNDSDSRASKETDSSP
ncbi:unnamed protein product [Periconia digitata]|uniref:Uncharacterized protein n=1 Tax=Periconia digitata TaxID=1303443 RepID=A0A9W4UAE8_9PLEO|nr:unnamed protein product [Periconia digitata]